MSESRQISQINEIELSLQKIAEKIQKHLPNPGIAPTALPQVTLYRRHDATTLDRTSGQIMVSLIAQGKKMTSVGDREFPYQSGEILICGMELPADFHAIGASPSKPFLAMTVALDIDLLIEAASQVNLESQTYQSPILVSKTNPVLLSAFERLLELLDYPEQIRCRSELLLRDLHYLLLFSPCGGALRAMIKVGSNNLAILKSVSWIKHNFTKAIRIADIASMANMSVSAFHRLFKTVTGFSPLQYQKRVRLYEARHLLFSEGQNVTSAAYSVGYESCSQFVREYKRLFGQPPHKDIRTKSDSINLP